MALSDAPSSPLGRPGWPSRPDPAVRPELSTRADLRIRIDAAHGVETAELAGSTEVAEPTWEVLQAIAGCDAQAASQQLRLQALELAAILREKQRMLEDREAVLNARTAKLDNDLRTLRLHGAFRGTPAETGWDLSGHGTAGTGREDGAAPSNAAPGFAAHAMATSSAVVDAGLDLSQSSAELNADRAESGESTALPTEIEWLLREDFDQAARASALDLDFQSEWESLEKDRRELQHRELSLIRRQRDVERLHDEALDLRREALELRLATEQCWEELVDHVPRVDLSRTLAELRARLHVHYRMASDSLLYRREELQSMRQELQSHEQRIRGQYREIQLWADRRYEELEARSAAVLVRERELEQREEFLQRQSLQWQEQQEDYRREIERLSWQLRDQRNWLD